MGSWSVYLLVATISAAIIAFTCGAEPGARQRKLPLALLKAVKRSQYVCDANPKCAKVVRWNAAESVMASDGSAQVIADGDMDYDTALSSDFSISVEKRRRRGCDCRQSSEVIDLGTETFPRYIRNVTCNARCSHFHSPCMPIEYDVTVMTMRSEAVEPTHIFPFEMLAVPHTLRCCWRAYIIPTVVGCICAR